MAVTLVTETKVSPQRQPELFTFWNSDVLADAADYNDQRPWSIGPAVGRNCTCRNLRVHISSQAVL